MKKETVKKVFAIGAAMVLCFSVLTGCGGNDKKSDGNTGGDSGSDASKALSGEHYKVAMSANFKYFETVTVGDDGKEKYEGIDIDILNYMADDLGFTYEISNMPFASLVGALQASQADFVISGMSRNEERAKSVDFSNPYATAKIGCMSKDGSKITSVKDLEGKKVACSAGTNYEKIVQSIEGAELLTYDGQAAVTAALIQGSEDACITGATACKTISEEQEGLEFFILDENEIDLGEMSSYNIAFPKGSELTAIFNDEIQKMKENGELDQIIVKWLGEDYVD